MARMKRGALVAFTMTIVATLIAGCNQPYSTPPAVTNTPINPSNLFATPSGNTGLTDVEIFATQTAQAANPNLLNTATPGGEISQDATFTATPFVQLPASPSPVPSATLAIPPSLPTSTFAPPPASDGSRPQTYTLQSQEFPFCIARRYNLDPDSLLAQNGLNSGTVFYAGYSLNLANVASPFPGNRALRTHPATYTVTGGSDTTVYGVACTFGDVTPDAIVAANPGISLGSVLNAGQMLNIP